MLIGTESPEWAKDLLNKWIELDDKHFGLTHNVFVMETDNLYPKIRIFAETESDARDDVLGKREPGLFATFITEDGFKVINTPEGLEKWTAEYIEMMDNINV